MQLNIIIQAGSQQVRNNISDNWFIMGKFVFPSVMKSNLFACMKCAYIRLYSLFSLYFPWSLSSWSGFLFY